MKDKQLNIFSRHFYDASDLPLVPAKKWQPRRRRHLSVKLCSCFSKYVCEKNSELKYFILLEPGAWNFMLERLKFMDIKPQLRFGLVVKFFFVWMGLKK